MERSRTERSDGVRNFTIDPWKKQSIACVAKSMKPLLIDNRIVDHANDRKCYPNSPTKVQPPLRVALKVRSSTKSTPCTVSLSNCTKVGNLPIFPLPEPVPGSLGLDGPPELPLVL